MLKLSLSDRRLTLVSAISLLIVSFDIVLVQTPLFHDHIHLLTAAIALDLVVVLPLLLYFLVYRSRQKSFISILPLALIGYLVLLAFMPSSSHGLLQIVKYVLIPLELLFVCLKSYELSLALRRSSFQKGDPIHSLRGLINETFGTSKLAAMIVHELSVAYYAVFAWRKRAAVHPNASSFSYHNKSGGLIPLLILVKILLLEGIVFHLLLMQWLPLAAWLFTLGNVYVLMLLLADFRAMRLNPVLLSPAQLTLRYGLKLAARVNTDLLASAASVSSAQLTKENLKKACTPPATEPNIVIHFKQSITVTRMFGMQETVNQLYLYLDEPDNFQQQCQQIIDQCHPHGQEIS
jgi:hypothetical protein